MNNKQKKRIKKVTNRYKVLFRNPYRIDDVYDYEYAKECYENGLKHYEHTIKKDSFMNEYRRLKKILSKEVIK